MSCMRWQRRHHIPREGEGLAAAYAELGVVVDVKCAIK